MVRHIILTLCCILAGCSKESLQEGEKVIVDFGEDSYHCKAMMPDEHRISDVSILVFDSFGMLEESIWIEDYRQGGCIFDLLTDKEYRFFACANFGYPVKCSSISELEMLRFHMAYPDELHKGIPMTADSGLMHVRKDETVHLKLIRLMAKVSLRMDRRRLSEDIEIKVRSVKTCNCPKSVMAFRENRIEKRDDCFSTGFYHDAEGCAPLNELSEKGISKALSVYVMENLQGRFNESGIGSDADKVLDMDDPRKDICSYVELCMDYKSTDRKSTGKGLIYRFYLGEDRNSLDMERNCHYRITVCPEDDGLKGDGWRVDKEDIMPIEPVSFTSWPDSYIRGNIGDKVHIGCTFTPSDAPFDVGLEYMIDDRNEGIYDFEIDEDGHGAVLTLTGPGRGLIYMEVGEPVNEAAMWIIEVNLPDS